MALGSKSFWLASRLFDAQVRESAILLYAWCRYCDDIIDGQHLGHGQSAGTLHDGRVRIENLHEATRRAIAGTPDNNAVFIGLADVLQRHDIPAYYPIEHLAGYRMDVDNVPYTSLSATLDYCWRVAGVVGVMMSMVMGRRDAMTLDRAADLGIAFQLTNIARDVVEDAKCERIYLPSDWLAQEGIYSTVQLIDAEQRPALARVIAKLIDAADPYYTSAGDGIASLPLRSAWSIATARGVYRHIGKRVMSSGTKAWDRRIHTSGAAKLWFVTQGAALALAAHRLPESSRPAFLWTRPY
jgi:15-cis-phytoene synthase